MRALRFVPALFSLSAATLINTQFPHLLVPLNSSSPNATYGTQKTGEVSNSIYTEVSFDVPGNAAQICRINFHVNTNPTKNAPRELAGVAPYQFNVFKIQPPGIDKDKDSWNKHSAQGDWVATIELDENYSVNVQGGWLPCPKWQVAQFLLKPVEGRNMKYWWFELDYPEDQGGPHGITFEMHT